MGLKLAVCDYPEHVTRETWLEFPKRMKAMGLTYVRIGEFAWSKLEPKRDQFEFAWLDEAIEALHTEGLRVVLCTPTATPPAWLIRAQWLAEPEGRCVLWQKRSFFVSPW